MSDNINKKASAGKPGTSGKVKNPAAENQKKRETAVKPEITEGSETSREKKEPASEKQKTTMKRILNGIYEKKLLVLILLAAFFVVDLIILIVDAKVGNEVNTREREYYAKEKVLNEKEQQLSELEGRLESVSSELDALSESLTTEEATEEPTTQKEKEYSAIEREFPEYTEDQIRKVEEIRNNPNRYPEDFQLLLHKNHETLDFVYNYPLKSKNPVDNDISKEMAVAAEGKVPLFLQWDPRWGYMKYGDGYMANNGCGPTCLAMVVTYLTGNADASPAKIAKYADDGGYYYNGAGTAWSLMSRGCLDYGVYAVEIGLGEEAMSEAVTTGHPIIAIVGRGDFTDGGHFIVLTGYENGEFTVNDPYSVKNSEKKWSYERLYKQIDGLWAFYLNK